MSNSIGTRSGTILAVAVLLVTAAIVVQAAYQTFRLIGDQDRLSARIQAQEPAVTDVQKVRAQLVSLAGQTALLAENGNLNAIRLREQLQAQGVVIRPPGS